MNAIVSNKAETTNHQMMPFATKVPLEVYEWLVREARIRKVTPSAVGREIFKQAYAERAGNRKRTPFGRETPGRTTPSVVDSADTGVVCGRDVGDVDEDADVMAGTVFAKKTDQRREKMCGLLETQEPESNE
jgi:hypothetical protein